MIVNLKEQHCENFLQSLHKEQWQEVRLGEVAKQIVSGGTPKSTQAEYYNGNIPWLNTKEVKNCRIYATERQITELGLCNSSAKWIDKNSVIVAMYGATAGKVAINKIPLTTNQACCNISVDSEKANYNFIYYTLLDSFDRLDQMTSGAAQQNLNVGLISNFTFLLPPLTTQQKIAEILSSFDDKIDLLHRQNKTLESLALTLFRHYFIDNPNRSEWEEKPLKYFGNIICGKTPPKNQKEYFNGTYPFIKIPDMHNNVFVFQTADSLTQQGLDSQKAKTLPPFSVCVSCIATIGVVSMNANIAQTNQQINSIVPHKEHYRYFLYCSMKSSFDELEAMASGGTATANLNTTDFSNMKLLLPREKEILRFHTETLPFFDKIYNNTKQIQNLQAMRDVLLKAIFKERE
ncbi:restriction endonuclease subunit S [Helicobacter cinaedi]|uniref:Type I restriction modification DNA specificity domain protein n=1 Tax=Helicobacter cinaedi CCUG 18818 = ATCC BAA-847 TaxID=537971 RepID=A0AAI8QI51_9HELI|nr:restriction endonuclease subunit S [Helicobacter cinaedi]EFR46136.1 type I restriction modification DNA specificity domain protein [Helicobacter cinaedi CCUG 18818 = ATCC BAA-847]QOQ90625.1 restriction endonuclease subunit S [Helicobacter cinaedi]BAM33495.1 hypothetical protein HCBAA847_2280 [Helicobacter cinaedi CCUG 18818 = ATCC BAA-847]